MGRAALILLLVFPGVACAGGDRATPGGWWRAWNWDALVLLNLGFLSWAYCRGLARRGSGAGQKIRRGHAAAYLGSLALLLLILISPLDALGEELSSAHMAQHMLLMMVAAPLFVLGAPMLVLAWGLPRPQRRWLLTGPLAARWLRSPSVAWVLYAVVLWAWHLPVLYQAALRDPLVHDSQHLSFFAVACLFWRAVLDPAGRRLHPGAAVGYLFTTSLHASVLGIFMALSPRPWYGDYIGRTDIWGLTPLADQQLAGLVMWGPACLIYPLVAALIFGLWLARLGEEREPAGLAVRGGAPT